MTNDPMMINTANRMATQAQLSSATLMKRIRPRDEQLARAGLSGNLSGAREELNGKPSSSGRLSAERGEIELN